MADGIEIGAKLEVAEALVPIRQFEAFLRLHLDIHGEQIIAAVRAVLGDGVHEIAPGETLPYETTEDVGERDDHGVDFVFVYPAFEFFEFHGFPLFPWLLKTVTPFY